MKRRSHRFFLLDVDYFCRCNNTLYTYQFYRWVIFVMLVIPIASTNGKVKLTILESIHFTNFICVCRQFNHWRRSAYYRPSTDLQKSFTQMFFLENCIPNQFLTQTDSFFASVAFISYILWFIFCSSYFYFFTCRHLVS